VAAVRLAEPARLVDAHDPVDVVARRPQDGAHRQRPGAARLVQPVDVVDAEPFEPVVAGPVELADEARVPVRVRPQFPYRAGAVGAASSSGSVRVPGGTWRISSSATTTSRERGRLRPRCQ
jgi:hypothetical protein